MSCRLCHQAIHPLICIEFKLMFAQIISMAHIHTHEELLHQLMEDTGVFTHFFCVDRNETLSFVTEIYCWYAHLISTHTAHTKHTKQSQLLFPFNEYPIILENFLFWSNLFWDDRRWGHKIRLQSKSDICRFNEMQLYRYNCVGEPQQQQFSLITSENVELNQECTKYKKRRRKQIIIADSFTVVHLSVAAATVFTACVRKISAKINVQRVYTQPEPHNRNKTYEEYSLMLSQRNPATDCQSPVIGTPSTISVLAACCSVPSTCGAARVYVSVWAVARVDDGVCS